MYLTVSAQFSLKTRKGEKNDEPGFRGISARFNKDGTASPIAVLGAIAVRILDFSDACDTPVERLQADLAELKRMVNSIEIQKREPELPAEVLDIMDFANHDS